MGAYLFIHFKEKTTPDGEQIYFGLSRDGYCWERVNDGKPVLWSVKGEKGVRDSSIIRAKNGKFYILSTDLSLANNFFGKYEGKWAKVGREGSKCLMMWESDDLVHWSEQQELEFGDEDFGCLWAPEAVYDESEDDYLIHWSSSHASNDYGPKSIFYVRTKDFKTFTKPAVLCSKEDGPIIDSSIYEEDGSYYRFLKSEANPSAVILEKGDSLTGKYERVKAFDKEMAKLRRGVYEAPTAYKLPDGKWCLMLDFYGCEKEKMGYVPFIADSLKSGEFIRSDARFHFPYGFKHGTVLEISDEEYDRVKESFPNTESGAIRI
ncbi:MAG: 1,4-beta-xylanase [Lachnospiraceae bacterium]|nr:1,4-beta-xylanase [Lachnospiraceae bacterium]